MNLLTVSGLFSAADSYGAKDAAFEIILMLLVAFVLGYLLHWLISRGASADWKTKYEGMQEKYLALEAEKKDVVDKKIAMENELTHTRNKLKHTQEDLAACMKEREAESLITVAEKEAEVPGVKVKVSVKKSGKKKDDLKKIEGIGPKIEKLFNNAGIKTFADLAETPVKKLEEILEKAGPRYRMHNPGTWSRQAKLAAEGKWEELKAWQAKLKRGRE